MGQIASETETVIYAWAVMTNHAHILLRSGPYGLSKCIQRFLIGYAMAYNHRHQRYGHLFQNRYKSIVCDEDSYFPELVRYIYLNPLRAKLVKNLTELDRYRWCGHGALMGRIKQKKGTLVLKQLKGHEIISMWSVPKYSYSLDAFSRNVIACYGFV